MIAVAIMGSQCSCQRDKKKTQQKKELRETRSFIKRSKMKKRNVSFLDDTDDVVQVEDDADVND